MKLSSVGIEQGIKRNRRERTDIKISGIFKAKFALKKRISFYSELKILTSSGIELSRALNLISHQEKSKNIKEIFQNLCKGLIQGKSMAVAMEKTGQFSKYEVNTIRAGEETRGLATCFGNLENFYQRKQEFRRKIISLLSYPAFVIIITLGVLYFMLNYVVPMFTGIFRQFGSELPTITKVVIRLSEVFDFILVGLLLGITSLIILHRYLKKYSSYKSFIESKILLIPFIGNLFRNIQLLTFYELMSLLLKARMSLPETLRMSGNTTSLYLLNKNVSNMIIGIGKGYSLSELCDERIFSARTITLIKIGEEVNELDQVFENLSKNLNKEINHEVDMFGKVMEPMILIIIALIVGFILVAMYYPMFSLSRVINA